MTKYWAFVVVVSVAALAVAWNIGALALNPDNFTLFGKILGTLLMLAIVLERALDVLLSIPRAKESDRLRAAVQNQQKIVETLEDKGSVPPPGVLAALQDAESERARFRARTMNLAMGVGLVLGVIISAVGFRALDSLIDPQALQPGLQESLFEFVDIVITGAVLAGGSDGIHKLIEVYRAYTEKGSK